MIAAIADHLWQSTIVALVIALLAVALRRNRAQVRYRLWLAASLKFLVPLAALAAAGAQAAGVGPTTFAALEEQLGLRLNEETGPVEALVIDRVEKPVQR
jgi:uncharacterized protein (TIGR03435 family)